MDPFIQLLTSSPLLSAGGWGFALTIGLYVLTGFTHRGWTNRKQRTEINEGRDKLEAANAATITKQDSLIEKLSDTNSTQANTIAGIDQFFGKLPVKTPPSGDAPSTESQVVN